MKGGRMRIGVIQASSQATKNQIIYDAVLKYAPKKSEVINFGCTMEENEKLNAEVIAVLPNKVKISVDDLENFQLA